MNFAVEAPMRLRQRLRRHRALAAFLFTLLILATTFNAGCAAPTREASAEALADKEMAVDLAKSYLETKYGLSKGEAMITDAEPCFISRSKHEIGPLDYIGDWGFEAEVKGEPCLVSANLRNGDWADDLQHDELAEAIEEDLAEVIDLTRLGGVDVHVGQRVHKRPGLENGLFDGANPYPSARGRNFHVHIRLACHDETSAEAAMEAIRAHYTDEVLQGTYLWVEIGVFPDGDPDLQQWQDVAVKQEGYYTWQVDYYGKNEDGNPYPREAIVPNGD